MYELLIPLIAVLFVVVKAREHFVLRVDPKAVIPVKQTPDDTIPTSWDNGKTLYTTDPNATKGTHILGTYPDSCPDGKDNEAGLCYDRCRPGYIGFATTCRAESTSVGVGKPVGLEPCPAGWINDGLVCREPLKWNSCKFRGLFNECWGGLEGGRSTGRLNGGGICDWPADRGNLPDWLVDKSDPKHYKATHPDKVDGLCYAKCPPNYPVRMAGFPYLCYKGGPILYDRGVGKIPCTLRVGGKCLFTGMSFGGD